MKNRKRIKIVSKVLFIALLCVCIMLVTACGSSKTEKMPETLPLLDVVPVDNAHDSNDIDGDVQSEDGEPLEEYQHGNYELPPIVPDD